MPRPQPQIIDAGRFRPGSPRYRYQPLPLRTAINQLERLVVDFGEDVIGHVREAFDASQLVSAAKHAEEIAAWKEARKSDATLPEPKARVDFDFFGSLFSALQGIQEALTGSTFVQVQTKHFLESAVEVEVDGPEGPQWVRLVYVAEGASMPNCDGYDYDLPPEDAFPLWWSLLEVNVFPLFRAAAAAMKRTLGKPMDGASSKPSSAPAASDSPDA